MKLFKIIFCILIIKSFIVSEIKAEEVKEISYFMCKSTFTPEDSVAIIYYINENNTFKIAPLFMFFPPNNESEKRKRLNKIDEFVGSFRGDPNIKTSIIRPLLTDLIMGVETRIFANHIFILGEVQVDYYELVIYLGNDETSKADLAFKSFKSENKYRKFLETISYNLVSRGSDVKIRQLNILHRDQFVKMLNKNNESLDLIPLECDTSKLKNKVQ